jgi:hypothetical protein
MTQAYNLSQLANNLNTSGQLDATDGLVNAVSVVNGGTGVNNATALTLLIGNVAFPIGSIYSATVATNPATLLGFGTWVSFGAGRVLIGNGGGFTAGATGGSADAIVVSHTHTATSVVTDPGHRHTTQVNTSNGVSTTGFQDGLTATARVVNTTIVATGVTVSTSNAATGSSGTGANLPPYIVVYMWTRTA